MNWADFEILFRDSIISNQLLIEIWDAMSDAQQLELLFHIYHDVRCYPPIDLVRKAAQHQNAAIRALVVACSRFSEEDEPDLYAQLANDPSPLVRGAMGMRKSPGFILKPFNTNLQSIQY